MGHNDFKLMIDLEMLKSNIKAIEAFLLNEKILPLSQQQ